MRDYKGIEERVAAFAKRNFAETPTQAQPTPNIQGKFTNLPCRFNMSKGKCAGRRPEREARSD
jgi:hypothetical protein